MNKVAPTRKNESTTENAAGDLLTVNEVARILRCDPTTVRRWIKQGALEAVVLPHLSERHGYRIRQTTLDTMFDTSKKA